MFDRIVFATWCKRAKNIIHFFNAAVAGEQGSGTVFSPSLQSIIFERSYAIQARQNVNFKEKMHLIVTKI